MKRRFKAHFKLNLISVFFAALSFISITFAWFAYSGIIGVDTTVDVRAWYIELEKDGKKVSNDIIISLDEIYPGMETVTETVNIKNMGDSDAQLHYEILTARILGDSQHNYVVNKETTTSGYVEDLLSHEFPFGINITLSKNFILSEGDESTFEVSISWPLDSDNNLFDSEWGTKAYKFLAEEERLKAENSNYNIKPCIHIAISLTAEQHLELDSSSDTRFGLGQELLVDVETKKSCKTLSDTCLKTYVIDENNRIEDEKVTLLPNPYSSYLSGNYLEYEDKLTEITAGWAIETRPLLINDLMKVISKDVKDSFLIRNNLTDAIIGKINSNERLDKELAKVINYKGYYSFSNERFNFLTSSTCYWTHNEFKVKEDLEVTNKAFALQKTNEYLSRIYGNDKSSSCKIIPIIVANKLDL